MRSALVIALVVSAGSSIAHAQVIVCTEDTCACTFGARVVLVPNDERGAACTPPAPGTLDIVAVDRAPHWEGALAFDGGSFALGSTSGLAFGASAALGVRFDRLALLGEYRAFAFGPVDGSSGTAAARSTMATTSSPASPDGFGQQLAALVRYSVLEKLVPCRDGRPCALRTDLWIEAGVGEEAIRWQGGGLDRPDVDAGLGWSIGGRGLHRHGGMLLELRATFARAPAGSSSSLDRSVLLATGFLFGS